MRIRSIKPEFWRSEDIAALDWETRLLFVGLWSYVDDNAVGIDRLADIAADLFALDLERDPTGTFARVSRGLQTLSDAGLVQRYSVAGRRYIAVTGFPRHQRIDKPNKARHPAPDQAERETPATSSRGSRETLAPGAGEQGNRGTGEEGSKNMPTAPRSATPRSKRSDDYSEDFEAFWSAYPRKKGKGDAADAFVKATKRAGSAQAVISAAERFAADPNLPEPEFVPYPATWLNQSRYNDEPEVPRVDKRRLTRDQNVLAWGALADSIDNQKAIGQ